VPYRRSAAAKGRAWPRAPFARIDRGGPDLRQRCRNAAPGHEDTVRVRPAPERIAAPPGHRRRRERPQSRWRSTATATQPLKLRPAENRLKPRAAGRVFPSLERRNDLIKIMYEKLAKEPEHTNTVSPRSKKNPMIGVGPSGAPASDPNTRRTWPRFAHSTPRENTSREPEISNVRGRIFAPGAPVPS
jgi:hypothetical protein